MGVEIQAEIINLVIMVVAGLLGLVTRSVTSYLNKKGVVSTIESNKQIVKIVVDATEQLYKELNGAQKLAIAKEEVTKLVVEKGLKITESEIDLLIESAVREIKANAK